MNKKAFTLAELLISMAIVGVIAALMVPVMMNSQKKSLETATLHFHSMLTQALSHYMVDNNVEKLADTPMYEDEYAAYDFIEQYLNVKKVCARRRIFNCFPKKIYNLNGDSANFELMRRRGYVLSNGAAMVMRPPSIRHAGEVQVDVNGKKGPNVVGRDIWFFSIYDDGVLSDRIHDLATQQEYANVDWKLRDAVNALVNERFKGCDGSGRDEYWLYGAGCFARFENNGFKFDY